MPRRFWKSLRALSRRPQVAVPPSPGVSTARPLGGLKRMTFFHEEDAEFQTLEPVARVAQERGYDVTFSGDLTAPAEIGVFCSHGPDPSNALFSAIMLHDLGDAQWPDSPVREPNLWSLSPWNDFDIGVLPGQAWSQCWQAVSWQASARPRLGVFELGWPKADYIFRDPKAFAEDVGRLRRDLGLSDRPSVLYAPSWEYEGKQDDFMPVNLLIKQANWPEEVARNREMTERHQALAGNICVIDPKVNIMLCLALANVVVSDASNCLAEALLFDVPGLSVTDWRIPGLGGSPPRFAEPPPFALTTVRSRLRVAVEDALHDEAELRLRMRLHRDRYFSCLGRSSTTIMDVLDSALRGSPWPVPPLVAQNAAGPALNGGRDGDDEGPAPVIDDFGPCPVKAGVPFNVQASGRSALWFRTRHVTYPTVVVLGGRELRSAVAPDGKSVSAVVPNELCRVPGEHAVFLFDKRRRLRSQVVTLRVE
jgi:hypothetical protein